MKTQQTDLQLFQSKFDCIHSKNLSSGLEVRVTNVDTGKQDAARLIKNLGLKLEISSEGNMVSQRAFLVKPIAA